MAKYTKQEWVDNETLINAAHMNHIEDGIEDASDDADSALSKANEVENTAITGINVNGTPATVTDHVAEIEVEGGNGKIYYAHITDDNIRSTVITVDIDGFTLEDGVAVALWIDSDSDMNIMTLNISGTGGHEIMPQFFPNESNQLVPFVYDANAQRYITDSDDFRLNELQDELNQLSQSAITAITVNGTSVAVSDNTAEIDVPTKTSQLENDSGYITQPTYDADNEAVVF